MSLSPRTASRTGDLKTYQAVCYGRNLSSYMEQLEDEYRWATSKVTRMIDEINTMRGQVHEVLTDFVMLRERAKTLEAERKQLLATERARRNNETDEVKYLDNLIEHLQDVGNQIQLRPCIVEVPVKGDNSSHTPTCDTKNKS